MNQQPEEKVVIRSGTGFRIWLWVTSVFLFLVARSMPTTMALFADMFQRFGADLPKITRFFLTADFLWWALFIFVLVIAIVISATNQFRQAIYDLLQVIFAILVVLAFGLIVVCIGAMYYPIFELGRAV